MNKINDKKMSGVSKLMNQLMETNGLNVEKTQEWREVDGLYDVIAHSIVNIGEQVNTSIAVIKENCKTVDNELIVTINAFKNDIETFTKDLVSIKKRHEGKVGSIDQDTDDYILCLSVFNDYVVLQDRVRAITFQPMLTITEHMMKIVEDNNIQKSKESLTDPTVVSDVVFKELDDDKDKVNV